MKVSPFLLGAGLLLAFPLCSPLSAAFQTIQPKGQGQQKGQGLKPSAVPMGWHTTEKAKSETEKEGGALPTAAPTRKAGNPALLIRLLAQKDAVFLRVDRYFQPAAKGKRAAILTADGGWLACKAGEVAAWFPKVPKSAIAKAKARFIDLSDKAGTAFAMPGIHDADSRWFRAPSSFTDNSINLAIGAAADLELWQKGWETARDRAGITSVFVPSSTTARRSGPGAIVSISQGPTLAHDLGAVFIQVSKLSSSGTTLTRSKIVDRLRKSFEGTKKYTEAQEKWDKSFKEFTKKRKEFLEYYKKNPLKPGDKPKEQTGPASSRRGSRGSSGRGRFRMTPEQREEMRKLPPEKQKEYMEKLRAAQSGKEKQKTEPKKTPPKTTAKAGGKKAPPRPKYPKKPKKDPVQEVLLEILANKHTVRIEVHRAPDIKAVLELVKEFSLENVVLVGATEAWKVADAIRKAGVTVLISPRGLPAKGFDLLPEHVPAQAALLAQAGVRVAFGSAGTISGRFLPLLAARAVSHGMSDEDALSALTSNALHASGIRRAKPGDKTKAEKAGDKAKAEKAGDKTKAEKAGDKAKAEKAGDKAKAEKAGDKTKAEKAGDKAKAKAKSVPDKRDPYAEAASIVVFSEHPLSPTAKPLFILSKHGIQQIGGGE